MVLITLLSSFVYLGNGNEQKPELSQTVPPDMVYIKGNDSIHSFYISVTEEPNINWRIYTDWLKNVYVDYPDVHEQALPLRDMQVISKLYNDPIIDNYANHPAYNYYPVVGVSWWQIQKYLQWKTDRLNEIILIENEILEFDYAQVNEENFNTESFLHRQYDGKTGKLNRWKVGYEDGSSIPGFENPFIMKKGVFIPHYRLPTEAEWDFASVVNKQNITNKKSYSIYGTKYFLKNWNKNAQKSEKQKKEISYPNTNEMASGVQEWLMDMEGFEYKSEYGSYDIYTKNGFAKIETTLDVFDDKGLINVKDSLGKLKFLFIDYDNTNRPIYVARVGMNQFKIAKEVNVPNPFYHNDSLFDQYLKFQNHFNYKIGNRYYTINRYDKSFYIKTKFINQNENEVIKYENKQRKVKSGNWKNPSTKTYLLSENEASELIGFRCMLPATSVAVNPKYKVKWD
jgi:formylglycine-generating enzyme required for sulfatase activity